MGYERKYREFIGWDDKVQKFCTEKGVRTQQLYIMFFMKEKGFMIKKDFDELGIPSYKVRTNELRNKGLVRSELVAKYLYGGGFKKRVNVMYQLTFEGERIIDQYLML